MDLTHPTPDRKIKLAVFQVSPASSWVKLLFKYSLMICFKFPNCFHYEWHITLPAGIYKRVDVNIINKFKINFLTGEIIMQISFWTISVSPDQPRPKNIFMKIEQQEVKSRTYAAQSNMNWWNFLYSLMQLSSSPFFFRVCLIFLFAIFVINRQKQDDLAG